MTCADVSQLLDAFVDSELPPPMLVAVARHAATCAACDAAVRDLTALHDTVGATMRADAEALDLSGIWPALAGEMDRVDARRAWKRRLQGAPLWGAAAMAMAASAVFLFRPASPPPRMVAQARPNHAVIERLDSGGHVELRRDRKEGTTLIMLTAATEPAR
jgi:anti-sigma factor RsiW